jgi:hypothetical protein
VSYAAPAAHAAPACTPTAIAGACVTVLECTPLCHPAPVVDPYCDIPGPVIAACETVDAFYITVPPNS